MTPTRSGATSSIPMSAGVAPDTYSALGGVAAPSGDTGAQRRNAPRVTGAECFYTHRALGAVRWYRSRLNEWRTKMGGEGEERDA